MDWAFGGGFVDGEDGIVGLGLPAGEPGFLEGRDVATVFWLSEVGFAEGLDEFCDPGLGFCAGFDLLDVIVFNVEGFAAHEAVAEGVVDCAEAEGGGGADWEAAIVVVGRCWSRSCCNRSGSG